MNSRMSTMNMLKYCDEALAWDSFSEMDKYFFESVRMIILGQCAPTDGHTQLFDLMGIERPVEERELKADYGKYDDIYYGVCDEDIPDYSSF